MDLGAKMGTVQLCNFLKWKIWSRNACFWYKSTTQMCLNKKTKTPQRFQMHFKQPYDSVSWHKATVSCVSNVVLEVRKGSCRSPNMRERRPAVAERGRSKKRVKNGGVEGTVSRGLRAFLPVCVNQQLMAAERLGGGGNIKMSEWNKRKGEIFYDGPKFYSVYPGTCLTQIVFWRQGLCSCIEPQITQMTLPAIQVIHP